MDAVLPKASATTVIEFVVDHVRDKLLRGLDRHSILGLRKQAEPSRATTKDALGCMEQSGSHSAYWCPQEPLDVWDQLLLARTESVTRS